MTDDDFEKPQYKVGKMDGDQRYFFVNRPLAQTHANRGQFLWGEDVVQATVEFEPDHGFVAVLYAEANIPSAWAEGYEVRTDWQPTKTPSNWVGGSGLKPTEGGNPKPTGDAPVRGATARVWAIADELHAETPLMRSDRARVIAACTAEGINKSTAATQWSKWAKSKGL